MIVTAAAAAATNFQPESGQRALRIIALPEPTTTMRTPADPNGLAYSVPCRLLLGLRKPPSLQPIPPPEPGPRPSDWVFSTSPPWGISPNPASIGPVQRT